MSDSSPSRVVVTFTEIAARPVSAEQQEASFCAAGHVFLGTLELRSPAGTLLTLPVQTGGWMNEDSPFCRAGLCPANPSWGAYDPSHYPDTAFPALPGDTILGTERTGRRRGFRIPDPPGTGRSALMIHDSARFGSEGCISTQDLSGWEIFCRYMAQLHSEGSAALPLRVVYDCIPPDHERCVGA